MSMTIWCGYGFDISDAKVFFIEPVPDGVTSEQYQDKLRIEFMHRDGERDYVLCGPYFGDSQEEIVGQINRSHPPKFKRNFVQAYGRYL